MTPEQRRPPGGPGQASEGAPLDHATVWQDLVLASRLLDTALERQAQRDGGISHGHFKLLVLLNAAPARPLDLQSIARTLRYSLSRVRHAIRALEREALVIRNPTRGGRRAYEATLTMEGRRLVGRVLAGQQRDITKPLFEALEATDVALLQRVSPRLVAILEQLPIDAPEA